MNELEFVTTRKRHVALVYEGFLFHKHSESRKTASIRYRCCHKNNGILCGMSIKISVASNEIIGMTGMHDHKSTYNNATHCKYDVIDELKEKVLKSTDESKIIYEKFIRNEPEKAAYLGRYETSTKNILFVTKQKLRPKLPVSASALILANTMYELNIYGRSDETRKDLIQHMHHQLPIDPRIHLFMTKKQCQIGDKCTLIMSDGTFKSRPRISRWKLPWAQVFTVHFGYVGASGHCKLFFGCCALLPDKKRPTYEHVLNYFFSFMLKNKCHLGPGTIELLCDYEKAMRTAWINSSKAFKFDVVVCGEFYHFTKALWKHLGKNNLIKFYLYNEKGNRHYFNKFRYWMQCLYLLPFFPPKAVELVYDNIIKPQLKQVINTFENAKLFGANKLKSNFASFLQYFESTWLGRPYKNKKGKTILPKCSFTIAEWNLFGQIIRTTNALETWHNSMKYETGEHKNIYDFIFGVQTLEWRSTNDYAEYLKFNLRSKARRPQYRKREAYITLLFKLCENLLNSNKFEDIPLFTWFKVLQKWHIIFYTTYLCTIRKKKKATK